MERIYPLTDDHLQHIIGMPVCAVMKNGLRYVGIAESCRGGRLILADPYGRPSYGYQQEAPVVSQGLEPNDLSEQKSKIQRTTSNKKNKSVRGKKQKQQPLAETASQEALYTNSAPGGYNPASGAKNSAALRGDGLHLDDIFLLFLIV